MTKSEQRLHTALVMVKTMADQNKEIAFEQISSMLQITNGIGSILKKMGLIVQNGTKKYQWIGSDPDHNMIIDFKKCRAKTYYKSNDDDDIIIESKPFQDETIDAKLNHIDFMINEIFERVEYLFSNLADPKIKAKVDSDWFTKKSC